MWKSIYDNAFFDEPEFKIKIKNLKKRMNNLNSKIEYLTIDNIKVGFCMLFKNKYNDDNWHLDYFAIDPLYQFKGYGTTLLNLIVSKYKKITLECENSLINYYNKFGFIKCKIKYYYNNLHLNFMSNFNNSKLKLIANSINNFNLLFFIVFNITKYLFDIMNIIIHNYNLFIINYFKTIIL